MAGRRDARPGEPRLLHRGRGRAAGDPRGPRRVHLRERLLGARGGAVPGAACRRVAARHRRADRQGARRDRVRQPGAASRRAAAHLRAGPDPAGEARRAGRHDRADRLRRGRRAGPRRARAHLRVLHQGVRPLRGPQRRRVLHARLGDAAAGRDVGAVRGAGARPGLRLGRLVRPVGRVREGARRSAAADLDPRPGEQPGDLADLPDEPRDPRDQSTT